MYIKIFVVGLVLSLALLTLFITTFDNVRDTPVKLYQKL